MDISDDMKEMIQDYTDTCIEMGRNTLKESLLIIINLTPKSEQLRKIYEYLGVKYE